MGTTRSGKKNRREKAQSRWGGNPSKERDSDGKKKTASGQIEMSHANPMGGKVGLKKSAKNFLLNMAALPGTMI